MNNTPMNPGPVRNMTRNLSIPAAVLMFALCLASAASASALNDFNLIVLGNLSGDSEVEGRVVVFGDIYGNSKNFASKSEAVADDVTTEGLNQTDGLIVGGEISGSSIQVNNGGVRTGDNDTGTDVNNAAYVIYGDDSVDDLLDAILVDIADTTAMLNGLTTDSYVDTSDMNNAVFNVNAGDDNIAVFDVDASFFNRNGTLDLAGDLSDVDLIVIRVEGDSVTASSALNTLSNEFALDEYQGKIIWYFPDATDLSFVNGLGGAIIAPNADLTYGSPIEGTVVVNNIVLGSEIHLPSLDTPSANPVPEPATVLLLGLGLFLILAAGRRRLAVEKPRNAFRAKGKRLAEEI